MQNDNTESSVMVSLRELVALESDRVAEEQQARVAAERAAAVAREQALAQQRIAEEARRIAEQQRREAQERRVAEEAVRLKAIKDAEVERARIEAHTQAQREVVAAQQLHEREMLSIVQSKQGKRLKAFVWVGAVVTLLAAGTGIASWVSYSQEQNALQARAEMDLATQRQQLKTKRLGDLDSMRDQLANQVVLLTEPPSQLTSALSASQRARARLSSITIEERDLDDYAQSLSALAAVLPRALRLQRLAALTEVHDKVSQQRARLRRPDKALAGAAERAAQQRQRTEVNDPSEAALRSYRTKVLAFADALPDSADKPQLLGAIATSPTDTLPTTEICAKGDPLCSNIPGGD